MTVFLTLSNGRFEGDGIKEKKTKTEMRRDYNRRHPEQRIADSHNRRARIRNAGGKLTPKECKDILDMYGSKCLKCGSTENITLDHVVPIALGGMNTADNIQTLCMMCNSLKGTSVVDYR